MAARTGAEYIKGLQAQECEVWLRGERVKDVTTHPGLANGVRAVASLYDLQHDPKLKDEMTFVSPTSGERLGLSFIIPRTRQELERRGAMMLRWARTTCGMMGRSPDFMNVTFAAWAAAAGYFARGRPEFGENIRRYYEYISERDLTLTHSLINLQRSRTASGNFNLEEGTALQVVRETDAGIVVRGVALPCATPGLKFLCRESFDLGRSHFEHPLGSRFEEMDCVVFFNDVLVPWERVFLLGDVDLLNATATSTHSMTHTAHQGAAKNIAKCEFVLGLALMMTRTIGNAHLPHSEERLAELMLYTELMKACMRASEADAQLDEWGVMCPAALPAESTRNLFMTAYPRMVEILQLLGSSSFMITPTEADFSGPLASEIEQYLATDTATARDRVKLFRLAWDVAGSAFGSRQVLYERFFASDPLTRARALNAIYPKDEVIDRVRSLLDDE